MKNILIVSDCGKRRNTTGLVGGLVSAFENLDKGKYCISLYDTNFFERNHKPEDYKVDYYYKLNHSFWDAIMRRLPGLRVCYANKKAINFFKTLLSKNKYDIVFVFKIPSIADEIVGISHAYGIKVIFLPIGSDILRVSSKIKQKLMNAFARVDAVVGRAKSNVLIAAQEVYKVPDEKIKIQPEGMASIIRLKKIRGTMSREEMHKEVGITISAYNIVCGYSGRETHRHRAIIDALIQVKDVLPEGYQIIFPMTYGAGQHHEIILDYAAQLKEVCDEAGLKTVFMTDFKTYEQMAYLHLITDLFIEIQPTDNGNAFMIEALYAQNQIVTGRWLNYQRFEQFGEPYYLIDKPEDLADKLRDIFTGKARKAKVPQKLVDFFDVPDDYDKSAFWVELFESL